VLLHSCNRSIAHSAVCTCCGLHGETFLHCVRDCNFSRTIRHHIGFSSPDFFYVMDAHDWLKGGSKGSPAYLFSTGAWWSWRHRNLMCLNNETWSLNRLSFNIQNIVEVLKSSFFPRANVAPTELFIKWNNNNYPCAILNVDGSCLGSPIQANFGGVIRNNGSFFLSSSSSAILDSSDILLDELLAIYHGLILAKNLGITEFVCYSNSLHCINLINGLIVKYHVYVVLIQDIKELLLKKNVTICHTLKEENQCANFLAKLELPQTTIS